MSGQLKNDTGERKLRVTLLSAGWKASSNGDLTTINRELATQMAKHPNVEVSVFLPQCSEEDKKDADSYNVKLIKAVKLSGFEPVDWLASVPEGHAMDCVIGHGVALGRQIQIIKKNPNYSHCKWIQFVHTSPEEIGMYKSISEGQKMQQTEIELCEMADQVVTIGPKLTDTYENQLGKGKVFNLTPSILTEFLDVQQARDERRTFCVLVTESGDSEDFDVKGYDIAVKAIANLNDKSYQLKFASKQRGKEDELVDKLLQCGIGRNQLIICSFDGNKETLANLFSTVDIAILPSKAEGFGLSALEAISAGLPVLVSGNSGIAEALKEVPNGSQCIVDSEDPADWAIAIKAVRNKKRSVRLAEAKILHGSYLQKFNWEEPCDFLVKKMCNLAFGGEMKITVGVDDLKPEEQNMQTGMLTTESVRQQEVQQPRVSATSAAPGSVSHPQTEDLLALKEKNFQSILEGCYHSTKPQSIEEWNWFREYAKEMRLIITGVSVGSLVITVKCESLMILEELWKDYSSGHLGEVVQNCFVTERILKELNLAELRLKTTMDIEEYNACKMFFEKDTLRDALSSEFHSTSSTSESSQKKQQWEKSEQKTKVMETVKLEGASSSEFHSISSTSESPQNQEELKKWKQETKIVETEKLKGTSPLTVEPTTGHGKELIEKEQQRKGMLSPHGSTTSDPEEKLEELHTNLKKQVTCSICLDTYTEPKILSCHHTFCCECLERHAIVNQRQGKFRCPECQVEINLPEGNRFDCLPNSFLHKSLLSVLQAESREGTSPSNVPFTAGHKKKWEVRHSTGKFQEKEGSSSPPLLSTTDLEEKIGKVCEEIKMLRMEGSSPHPVSTVEVELEELLNKLQKGRMKGSSPPPLLSTTDLEEKLGKVCEEIKMLRMEGSFPVLKFSSMDLEKKLAELRTELKRLRMEGTLPPPELFTADFEEELEQLRTELITQRVEGSSARVEEELFQLLKELQKGRKKALENVMYSTIRSGLAKFDVSLPEELQSYVSYLFKESAKLGLSRRVLQAPRALEELRKVMDEDGLKKFLTIHIREGAWQVVLLFMDELPEYELPPDWYHRVWDEEMFPIPLYSSTSGILKAWPTEYDPGLITLCKAITNRDWKVTRLIFSRSQISDERLKNLSTALTRSELYSLTLYDIGLQSQGLKHLYEALISSDCHLTSLNVSYSRLGDEGIMYLYNALTSVNCTLTSLNVSHKSLGDKGIMYLCNALISVDCTLTSLNVSSNRLGDEGIMLLCNALTSVNCRLTSLNVSYIQWGEKGLKHLCDALTSNNCALTKLKVDGNGLGDGGIKELSEVLTNGHCTLTSIDICSNQFGDDGIKHLCKALTDTHCKLRSLDYRGNWNVTDEGEKYLSQMLTGTDWGVREAQLSRSTTK